MTGHHQPGGSSLHRWRRGLMRAGNLRAAASPPRARSPGLLGRQRVRIAGASCQLIHRARSLATYAIPRRSLARSPARPSALLLTSRPPAPARTTCLRV